MAKYINIRGNLFDLSTPVVMSIINITPDSFYKNSRYSIDNQDFKTLISRQISEGAKILDLGGYSTRPNAEAVSLQEELNRVLPVIDFIKNNFPEVLISVDTFRSKVAHEAILAGADLINDISGGLFDDKMFEVIAQFKIPYILMHNRGKVETMHEKSNYKSIVNEVIFEIETQLQKLRSLGIHDVIIDPGFGFSKNIDQNFELLSQLDQLKTLNCPILSGISRKSMIWKTLNISAKNAINGTTALNMISLMKGASILRVHDAKEATECIELFNKMSPYLEY